MQRSRVRTGSVVQDKRDKVWRFYWWDKDKRRSKKLGKFASKTAAIQEAEKLREDLRKPRSIAGAERSGASRGVPSGKDAKALQFATFL